MQLTPDLAASYGVDPCSPEVAIVTGAAHLVTLYREHGDWAAALEAYGGGEVPIVPVGGSGQTFAAAVQAQWETYKAQFGGAGPGVPVGSGPVAPKGDTSPFTEEPGLPQVTQRMLAEIIPMFGRGYDTFCFGQRDGPSDHPSGHACDFVMSSPLGTMPTPEYLAHGWALCNYLIDNADRLRVKYVIWQKRIWELGRVGRLSPLLQREPHRGPLRPRPPVALSVVTGDAAQPGCGACIPRVWTHRIPPEPPTSPADSSGCEPSSRTRPGPRSERSPTRRRRRGPRSTNRPRTPGRRRRPRRLRRRRRARPVRSARPETSTTRLSSGSSRSWPSRPFRWWWATSPRSWSTATRRPTPWSTPPACSVGSSASRGTRPARGRR